MIQIYKNIWKTISPPSYNQTRIKINIPPQMAYTEREGHFNSFIIIIVHRKCYRNKYREGGDCLDIED